MRIWPSGASSQQCRSSRLRPSVKCLSSLPRTISHIGNFLFFPSEAATVFSGLDSIAVSGMIFRPQRPLRFVKLPRCHRYYPAILLSSCLRPALHLALCSSFNSHSNAVSRRRWCYHTLPHSVEEEVQAQRDEDACPECAASRFPRWIHTQTGWPRWLPATTPDPRLISQESLESLFPVCFVTQPVDMSSSAWYLRAQQCGLSVSFQPDVLQMGDCHFPPVPSPCYSLYQEGFP